MELSTTLFYTLSTMPQVTGAAISLLAVFYIFKVQDINAKLKGIVTAVLIELEREPLHKAKVLETNKYLESRLQKCIELDDFTALKENIHEVVQIIDTQSFKDKIGKRHDKLTKSKDKLNGQFKSTFWVTSILLILFLVGVTLTSFISQSTLLTWIVLISALIVFGINIILIARTITSSLTIT